MIFRSNFEPAVNVSAKTTSSYSGKGFNSIVRAPFLTKKMAEEPPVTGKVTETKPMPTVMPEDPSSARFSGFHRVKKLLSEVRPQIPPQERRVAQTDSPFQTMAKPKIQRPEPSRRLSPEGIPEHMHQAHRDNTVGGMKF